MTADCQSLRIKLRNEYPIEVEAAWYVLRDFINPLDCSEIYEKSVLPLNNNSELASVLSGNTLYKPEYFTKAKLYRHLSKTTTYYYRCKYDAIHTVGYGSSVQQAQNLPFASQLNITSKRKKYDYMNVILLGIDIDGHHGEKDTIGVQQWITDNYFENSYWEPSTHYSGRHGYVKLAYPREYSLTYVISVITQIFTLLDKKREISGFSAPLDIPCGLPTIISYVDENPYPAPAGTDIPVDLLDNSFNSSPQNIPSTAPPADTHNNSYIKIKRSQAFKIPRFCNSKEESCNLESIIEFHNFPFYPFSYLETLLENLKSEQNPSGNNINNREGESVVLTTMCTPRYSTYSKSVKWEEIPDKDNNNRGNWRVLTNMCTPMGKKSYVERIEECRMIQNTLLKTSRFYFFYAVHMGEVPAVEEAVSEYIKQGLNTNSNPNSPKRIARFTEARKWVVANFDRSKCGINYDEYEISKSKIIEVITEKTRDMELVWKKGKNRVYELSVEELAVVYYTILRENEIDRNLKSIIKNAFSYNQVRIALLVGLGVGCHKNKAARILGILRDTGMIEKVGGHIPGVRGTCYQAVEWENLSKAV